MKVFFSLLALAAATLGTAHAQNRSGAQQSSTPNYKPAPGSSGLPKNNSKPGGGAAGKVVVSPGGQGHNSGPDPKGKVLVAPSVTTTGKGAAKPAAKH